MWRAVNDDGTLVYTFIESVARTYPFYAVRLLGGTLFLAGMFVMAWNVWRTIKDGKVVEQAVMAPAH